MPPILKTTPSPKTFAEAWTREFEKVVRQAAGRDGRLSITEAKRIAERTDGGRLFSDNAQAWLFANHQKSVSVNKLVAAAHAYAEKSAIAAAGADGRLSYPDAASKLRPDLRDDFLYLRGKIVDGPQRTQKQLVADVRDAVLRAFDNGTAKQLSAPPAAVRGRRELFSHLPHDASGTALTAVVANDRIYVSRSASFPTPLVGWYDAGTLPKVGAGTADLRAKFESVTHDLWLTSESDAKVKFIVADGAGSGPIDEALVRKKFAGAHDVLGPTLYGRHDSNFVKLADRPEVALQDGRAWLEDRAEVADPDDPAAVAEAQKWRALADLVKAELTDVKVYRFGTIDISVMLVGRTKSGELAGFLSAVVET